MDVQTLKNRAVRFAAGVGAVVATGAANAAIDVSGVTGVIGDGVTAAATVGGLALAFVAGIKIFNKIRGAV